MKNVRERATPRFHGEMAHHSEWLPGCEALSRVGRPYAGAGGLQAPICCISDRRLPTPQWSVIFPFCTRMSRRSRNEPCDGLARCQETSFMRPVVRLVGRHAFAIGKLLPLMVAIIGGEPRRFRPLIDLYRETGHRHGHSPERLKVGVHALELPSRSMLMERDAHDLRGAFLHGLLPSTRVQVRRREAGIDRVHDNVLISQFEGKLDGEHVRRRFRRAVAQDLHRRRRTLDRCQPRRDHTRSKDVGKSPNTALAVGWSLRESFSMTSISGPGSFGPTNRSRRATMAGT